MRSTAYGGHAGDGPGDGSEAHIMKMIRRLGANCPYDTLLIQEGTDFQLATRTLANQIHAWNARGAWPRMVCGTFDMFFERMAAQTDAAKVKTFGVEWVDTNAPHAFNEYLYEFRTHANGLDYSSVWSRMEPKRIPKTCSQATERNEFPP